MIYKILTSGYISYINIIIFHTFHIFHISFHIPQITHQILPQSSKPASKNFFKNSLDNSTTLLLNFYINVILEKSPMSCHFFSSFQNYFFFPPNTHQRFKTFKKDVIHFSVIRMPTLKWITLIPLFLPMSTTKN